MKLPRNVSGTSSQSLKRLGYMPVQRRRSHARVTTQVSGEHEEGMPPHSRINARTVSSIAKGVTRHDGMSVQERLHSLEP
ncbi:MAG: hypothetical protein OXN89_00515 [Bryobacterales bacterium]|nr:hypothetical protein [Bryobacterales bacterium]